jgi:protease PrsW
MSDVHPPADNPTPEVVPNGVIPQPVGWAPEPTAQPIPGQPTAPVDHQLHGSQPESWQQADNAQQRPSITPQQPEYWQQQAGASQSQSVLPQQIPYSQPGGQPPQTSYPPAYPQQFEGGYSEQPVNPQHTGYPPQNAYPQQPAYPQQGYPQQPAYPQHGYPQQPAYPQQQQPSYPPQPAYGQPDYGQPPAYPQSGGYHPGQPQPPQAAQPQAPQVPFDAGAALKSAGKTASGLFGSLGGRIGKALGLETVAGLSAKSLFGEVFTKHTSEDVEEMFLVGTRAGESKDDDTSNFVAVNDVRWPKPWLFARIFLFGALIYFAFRVSYQVFDNLNLIPGLQIVGAFTVPLAVVVFYFEMNAPRNVPLYVVVKYVIFGGIASLAISLIGFETVGDGLSWANASAAGPIEEVGKAAALLLMVRIARYRWTLNGLLFGGAIGAGFAGFETAGYALKFLIIEGGGPKVMVEVLTLRAVLAPGGHVVWTAIVGAALWRVKGNQPFRASMIKDRRFLSALAFTVTIHAIWNSPISGTFGRYPVPVFLTAVSWLVLLMYVQHGLKEWRDAHSTTQMSVPAA